MGRSNVFPFSGSLMFSDYLFELFVSSSEVSFQPSAGVLHLCFCYLASYSLEREGLVSCLSLLLSLCLLPSFLGVSVLGV